MRRTLIMSLIGIILIAGASFTATVVGGNEPVLGLDLQGGASVVLRPKDDVDEGRLQQAVDIIRSRVDALGVAEPEIALQGDAIVVELPGVKDAREALDVVGQTAELRFRIVQDNGILGPQGPAPDPTAPTEAPAPDPNAPTSTVIVPTSAPASATTEAGLGPSTTIAGEIPRSAEAPTTTAAPAGDTSTTTTTAPAGATTSVPESDSPTTTIAGVTPKDEDLPDKQVVLPQVDEDGNVVARYVLGPALITGRHVKTAQAAAPQLAEGWSVLLQMTDEGATKLNELAAANVGKQMAIILDSRVISAPTLQEASFPSGRATITGVDEEEAKDLALVLRYGALPVELQREAVQTVSPSLGRDSLRAGVGAGLVGLALVLLYMIVYYRALGIVVVLGLMVSAALMYSIIVFLGSTQGLALSLAGATGIIVSVGVTVDSYVVYFERLKDEIRSGKSIRSSVDRGFTKAFRTIVAADISSLIGAVLLYTLTVGAVRGFAFFLGLSTLLDLVIAYFFTRPMVVMLGRSRLFTEAPLLGVARGLAAAPAGGTS